jgi:hypothetical protein
MTIPTRAPAERSPLRDRLCSRDRAILVAQRMRTDGIANSVVFTTEPFQPWRIVENNADDRSDVRRLRVRP